jgi:SAM-dependent methyltransferase
VTVTDNPQAGHYDTILDDYDRHYYDPYSLQYREQFILAPLLEGVDLRGKRVADLASGSGETTMSLIRRFAGVQCTGFDISPEACRRYREKTHRPAFEFDLTRGTYEGEPFDAAIIMGGLHHCTADLARALRNVAAMLRPGGVFLFFEPNSEYVLESARKLWYRFDRYFDESSERALSHRELMTAGGTAFEPQRLRYFGGPAFFLVYNSLVFRLSHRTKAATAPALLRVEQAYGRIPSKWMFASFLAQWVRRA